MRKNCRPEVLTQKMIFALLITAFLSPMVYLHAENWTAHPEWLWFDDFESGAALNDNYQDVNTNNLSIVTEDAFQGTHSLCQKYDSGQVDAGWITRVENQGFPSHLFMRWYHKFENGFDGFPPKMARMRYRIRSGDWTSIFAVHCWIQNCIVVADVSAKTSTQANSTGWLPVAKSNFTFEYPANIGRWVCFEMEVLLNTPGKQDGLYRIWVDNILAVERVNVDIRGTDGYLFNEVMLDCYWNGGSPKVQKRYFDNFVISTSRIGPAEFVPIQKGIYPAIPKKETKRRHTLQMNINSKQNASQANIKDRDRNSICLLSGILLK